MDLFVVDRYMGDEESQDKALKQAKESKKLSLLKKHIETRKRTIALLENNEEKESPRKETKKAKLKVKKTKAGKAASPQPNIHQEEQVVEESNRELEKSVERDTVVESAKSLPKDGIECLTKEQPSFTIIGRKKKKEEVHKVEKTLPDWLAKPIIIETDLSTNLLSVEKLRCISPHILKRLKSLDINSLFPVQKAVIPAVLDAIHEGSLFCVGGDRPSDICVSAPTGSGKTLSYVVPIIQTLSKQPVRLLQALILLPTKDLACQVKQVFDAFVEGTSLKVGLACGNKALAKEQESLNGQGFGSSSRVNILVATPGRLVDHLSSTPQFTLQHLRFLVIDEADRLLDQSYHDWLNRVLSVTYQFQQETLDPRTSLMDNGSITMNLQTRREPPTALTPAESSKLHIPLQKLLFSATMTNSPEKLASLHLYNPMLYIASKAPLDQADSSTDVKMFSRYTVPQGLLEYMVVCNSGEKPLVLLYLMTQMNLTGVLCFTSSLEATHRLFLLVSHFDGISVAEYSSSLNAQQRHGVLRDFRQGRIQLLICSDAMARGMDIDNVSYVISYDAPKYVKSYIHRVGRTARAGNKGTAYTLLYSEQVHHFKELIQKTGRDKIPKHAVKDAELQPLVDKYQAALEMLQQTIKSERNTTVEQGTRRKGQAEIGSHSKKQLLKAVSGTFLGE